MTQIVVTGSPQSGKTAWIRRMTTGEWTPTTHPVPTSLLIHIRQTPTASSVEGMVFELVETDTPLTVPAAACILFVRRQSIDSLRTLIDALPAHLPVVVCFSRADEHIVGRKAFLNILATIVQEYRGRRYLRAYHISARSCYNLEKPLLDLARVVRGEPNLIFTEAPSTD